MSKNQAAKHHPRKATLHDASAISSVLKDVFKETYASVLTKEVLDKHLSKELSAGAIQKDLILASYFVIEDQQAVQAVLKLLRHNDKQIEIAKLYVSKNARALGLGACLVEQAFVWSSEQGAESVFLKVWEENLKAIGFYERQGFAKQGMTEVWVDTVVFKDFLMEKKLND